jgi:hypothetical protein
MVERNRTPMPRRARSVGATLLVVGVLNIILLGVIGLYLGGHAGFGRVEGGHYYVAAHGQYSEVSRAAWTVGRGQEISLLVTLPLMVAGFFLRYGFPPRRGRGDGGGTSAAASIGG